MSQVKQILLLLKQGRGNKEIARMLEISKKKNFTGGQDFKDYTWEVLLYIHESRSSR